MTSPSPAPPQTPEQAWRTACHQASEWLARLQARISQSAAPDAEAALTDLRAIMRQLAMPSDTLRALLDLEHRWATDPAWLDLRDQAPAFFNPLQQALAAFKQAMIARTARARR